MVLKPLWVEEIGENRGSVRKTGKTGLGHYTRYTPEKSSFFIEQKSTFKNLLKKKCGESSSVFAKIDLAQNILFVCQWICK